MALLLSQQNRPWYHTNKITFYWEICIHSVFCSFVSISDRSMMRRELKCLLEFQPISNEYKWANLTSRFGSVKEYWNKVFDTVAVLTVLVIKQTKIMIKLIWGVTITISMLVTDNEDRYHLKICKWSALFWNGYHPSYGAKQGQKGRTRFPKTADNLAFSL